MQKFLIAAAAVAGGIAVIALARRVLKNREEKRKEAYFAWLRESLGVKTGDAGDKSHGKSLPAGPDKKVDGEKGAKDGKPASTVLMLHPDANGLRVNGAWLQTINNTFEADPIHGSRASVRESLGRARRFNNDCNTARKQRNWELAEAHAQKALAEVNSGLRRDHWFTAEVLNQYGCVRYDQGFYAEARELWEQAEQVCEEWPTSCRHVLPTIQSNLKLVIDMLGF